jgi:hypothetical protein
MGCEFFLPNVAMPLSTVSHIFFTVVMKAPDMMTAAL